MKGVAEALTSEVGFFLKRKRGYLGSGGIVEPLEEVCSQNF